MNSVTWYIRDSMNSLKRNTLDERVYPYLQVWEERDGMKLNYPYVMIGRPILIKQSRIQSRVERQLKHDVCNP
jgi:hypothetical protein